MPAVAVGGDPRHLLGAEAEELQGGEHGGVGVLADQDADRRCAGQTARLDVPSDIVQHLVPGRGEPDEIGQGRAGDEADRRLGGKAEDIEQPA